MTCHSPSGPWSLRLGFFTFLACTLSFIGCSETPPEEAAMGSTPELSGPPSGPAVIDGEFFLSDGTTPPEGDLFTARLFNSLDGSVTPASVESDGSFLIEVDGDVLGCVIVTPAARNTFDAPRGVWPPEDGATPGSGGVSDRFEIGAMTGKGKNTSAEPIPSNVEEFCDQKPVVKLKEGQTFEPSLTSFVGGQGVITYVDLNGQPGADGFAVAPVTLGSFDPPEGTTGGAIALAANPADNGETQLFCPAGETVVLESGFGKSEDTQGNLTSTFLFDCPAAGDEVSQPLQLQPLMCHIQRTDFEDQVGKDVTIVSPARDGWRCKTSLEPLGAAGDRAAAIWLTHVGAGEVNIKVRVTRADGSTESAQRSFFCSGSTCTNDAQKGSSEFTIRIFHNVLAEATTEVLTTWSLEGLPVEFDVGDKVTYRIETEGAQFPPSSRETDTEARKPIKEVECLTAPEACTGGESNDDKWGII